MKTPHLFIVAVIASLLLILGCGDDESSTPAQDTHSTPNDTSTSEDTSTPEDTSTGDTSETDGDTVEEVIDLRIPGLSAPVKATYDEHGVLHLTCQTDDDCFAALGYFHASNRFFFMDFVRTFVRGRLAHLTRAGDLVLGSDVIGRHIMTSATGQPLEELYVEQLSPENLRLVQRYADGINSWLDDVKAERNGAKLTVEYSFPLMVKENILPWEPEDTMAFSLYMFNDLANSTDVEMYMGSTIPKLDATFAADLFAFQPAYNVATMPAAGETFEKKKSLSPKTILDLKSLQQKLARAQTPLEEAQAKLKHFSHIIGDRSKGDIGSNNWIVGASRTATGRPILSNDPHLSLTNPSIWMPVEIDSSTSGTGTIHAGGGTIPGIPSILSGHNEHLAWGITTIYYDLTDVYLETLNASGDAVIFNGEEVPILKKTFTFKNASTGQDVERELEWVPHHGPLLSKDLASGTAVSFRWVAAEGSQDFSAFLNLMRADDTASAREALKTLTVANQNFILIDDTGDIAWFPFSSVPKRPWDWMEHPPWLPMSGEGSAEWDGFFSPDVLPQMQNPSGDFIVTANQDITGFSFDGDPTTGVGPGILQEITKATGIRMARIIELIEAEPAGGHTRKSMLDIQSDHLSILGRLIVPRVLAAAEGASLSPETQRLVTALSAWEYTCPTGLSTHDPEGPYSTDAAEISESIGCTIFHTTYYGILRAAFGDEFAPAQHLPGEEGISRLDGTTQLFHTKLLVRSLDRPETLHNPDGYWDNINTDFTETWDDVALSALAEASERLDDRFGADPNDWRWGRIHVISLSSPFASIDPGLTGYNAGPYANNGGLYTVDVASPLDRDNLNLRHYSGASVRTIIEFTDDGPQMKFQLPGGTDLHRDGMFYNTLMEPWLENKPFDFIFGPDALPNPTLEFTVNAAE